VLAAQQASRCPRVRPQIKDEAAAPPNPLVWLFLIRCLTKEAPMTTRVAAFLTLTALVVVGTTGGAVATAASEESFTATEVLDPDLPGDAKVWRDEEGVFHVRDNPRTGVVTGDITGTIAIVENRNVDTNTGTGDFFGTFTLTTAEGSWSGHFSGTVGSAGGGAGVLTLELIGQGSGGLEGTKLSATSVGSGRIHTLTGTILDPKG
jgi:hypothetical protein